MGDREGRDGGRGCAEGKDAVAGGEGDVSCVSVCVGEGEDS